MGVGGAGREGVWQMPVGAEPDRLEWEPHEALVSLSTHQGLGYFTEAGEGKG